MTAREQQDRLADTFENAPLRIFVGWDPRQAIAYTALQQSIISTASKPVSITPLVLETLPIEREGLTPFTFSRFLVPWLCNYEGWALFLDADIMLRGDVAELFALRDESEAVMVSKNNLEFEWASVMLFNNPRCTMLTPERVEQGQGLHTIKWTDDVGSLPPEWNHLVGYDPPNENAKLVHYTQGVPFFPETAGSEHGDEWMEHARFTVSSKPWQELMGRSVHAQYVYERLAREGKINVEDPQAANP